MIKKSSELKIFGLLIFSVAILILAVNLVSAQSIVQDLTSVFKGFVDVFAPLASIILGDVPGGELLFAKVLILIIVMCMVFIALDNIPILEETLWAHWVITIAVAVLGVRFLTTPAIIQTIILPYSTFAIAVSAGFPFVLYFMLINIGLKKQPAILRKTAWIFFAVIFVGLFFSRYNEIKNIGWIYIATAIGAIIVAAMDGTISKFFNRMGLQRAREETVSNQLRSIRRELAQADRDYATGGVYATDADYRYHVASLRKKITNLEKAAKTF